MLVWHLMFNASERQNLATECHEEIVAFAQLLEVLPLQVWMYHARELARGVAGVIDRNADRLEHWHRHFLLQGNSLFEQNVAVIDVIEKRQDQLARLCEKIWHHATPGTRANLERHATPPDGGANGPIVNLVPIDHAHVAIQLHQVTRELMREIVARGHHERYTCRRRRVVQIKDEVTTWLVRALRPENSVNLPRALALDGGARLCVVDELIQIIAAVEVLFHISGVLLDRPPVREQHLNLEGRPFDLIMVPQKVLGELDTVAFVPVGAADDAHAPNLGITERPTLFPVH
mmetsp:Transcript_44614/g.123647  ORF Transcript_44614/g.123647 Transcript_44614/m.123647 type:complete len:290 (+) Transcript_44614:314-1183(+)